MSYEDDKNKQKMSTVKQVSHMLNKERNNSN